jgi:hypothetical protein
VALVALVAGCSGLFAPPRVDGIPIGSTAPCSYGNCDRETAFARAWLDTKAPGHAAVRAVEIHLPDYRAANGDHLLLTRSGGRTVVAVLRLEDGSIRAVLIGCGVGVEPDRCGVMKPPAEAE